MCCCPSSSGFPHQRRERPRRLGRLTQMSRATLPSQEPREQPFHPWLQPCSLCLSGLTCTRAAPRRTYRVASDDCRRFMRDVVFRRRKARRALRSYSLGVCDDVTKDVVLGLLPAGLDVQLKLGNVQGLLVRLLIHKRRRRGHHFLDPALHL